MQFDLAINRWKNYIQRHSWTVNIARLFDEYFVRGRNLPNSHHNRHNDEIFIFGKIEICDNWLPNGTDTGDHQIEKVTYHIDHENE